VAFFVYSSNEDGTPGLQLLDARAIQVTITTEMFSQTFLTKENIIFSQAQLTRKSVSQFCSCAHEGKILEVVHKSLFQQYLPKQCKIKAFL